MSVRLGLTEGLGGEDSEAEGRAGFADDVEEKGEGDGGVEEDHRIDGSVVCEGELIV